MEPTRTRKSQGRRRRSGRKQRPQLRQVLKWGLAVAVIALMADILYALLTLPSLPVGGINPDQPSMVYAKDGTAVGPLSDVFRIPVQTEELPDYVAKAYVASEDIRFYRHPGIDIIGIGRALVNNLKAGEIQEGGSTITQQVARMSFLSTKQTLNRKIQEAALALILELKYDKDEILSMYLNQVYLGHGAYGVGAGAKLYFNKDAADLTLSEAAMLAGITPSPENYNPLAQPDVARRQRDIVLDRMVTAGYLTEAEAEAEKTKPLEIQQGHVDTEQVYPWYMDAIRQELETRYHLDERMIDLMGLQIYTGLDPTLQSAAENALANQGFPSAADGLEGAFVAVDPRSGEVRAVVGGRDYTTDGGFNRAMDGKISPGSVFKPVMVYAPAFEYAGFTPESTIEDKPIDIDGWKPLNWDYQFRGEVTVREAARLSLNSPAIQMLDKVGINKAKKLAQSLGITFADGDDTLTLALGSMQQGVSPLQLAAAYQAFANGGYYREPHLVTKVVAADGVLVPGDLKVRRAISSQTAYYVTDILQTVVQSGTGTGAQIGRPMAGKTGTVELPDTPEFEGVEGNAAAWFVGYTPDLVAAVWLGYDQTDGSHYLPSSVNGSTYPTAIWRQAVGKALAGSPALNFPGPDGSAAQAVAVPNPSAKEEEEPEEVELQTVQGLALAPGTKADQVILTWAESRPEDAKDTVAYRVFRSVGASADMDQAEVLATVTEPTYTDQPPAGGTYYYWVAMVNLKTEKVGTPSAPVGVVINNPEGVVPGGGKPEPGGVPTGPEGETPGEEGTPSEGSQGETPSGENNIPSNGGSVQEGGSDDNSNGGEQAGGGH